MPSGGARRRIGRAGRMLSQVDAIVVIDKVVRRPDRSGDGDRDGDVHGRAGTRGAVQRDGAAVPDAVLATSTSAVAALVLALGAELPGAWNLPNPASTGAGRPSAAMSLPSADARLVSAETTLTGGIPNETERVEQRVQMRQVRPGQTDLRVSAIAFGTWGFGGDWGPADVQESTAAISHALVLGITLFDTARGYGFGAAERLLGRALWLLRGLT
jgi:hypothetical protein